MASKDEGKSVNFRIDVETWEKFQKYSRSKGCSASALINQYIRQCLESDASAAKIEALEGAIASLTERLEAIEAEKKQWRIAA